MKLLSKLSRARKRAFSLIELMVSITVLSMLLVIVFQMLEQMQRTWKRTRQSVAEFKDARTGFDELGRRLGQATLNAYYGYRTDKITIPGTSDSVIFGREITPQSELHFVSGPSSILFKGAEVTGVGTRPGHAVFFQGPFGFCVQRSKNNKERLEYEQLNSLLNAWGYYVEFNSDEMDRPRFLSSIKNAPLPRLRYRLMEFRQPTEYLQIYKLALRDKVSSNQQDYYQWFTTGLFGVNSPWNTSLVPPTGETFFRTTRPIAENIIAMLIQPRDATPATAGGATGGVSKNPEDLAPEYLYDTRRWQWSGSKATTGPIPRSKHQLPAILDITFVAVDEGSFANFAARTEISKVEDDPELVSKELFTKANVLAKDVEALEKHLTELKLEYKIFSSSIRLREAKWIDN